MIGFSGDLKISGPGILEKLKKEGTLALSFGADGIVNSFDLAINEAKKNDVRVESADFNFSEENIMIENEDQDSDELYDHFIIKITVTGGERLVLCLSEAQIKALLEIFSNYVKGRDAIKSLQKTVSVKAAAN
jgi:hypothetical protein